MPFINNLVFGQVYVPTVYPKISKVIGSDWFELELPTNTTANFVQDLAILVPQSLRKKIDGFRIHISLHCRDSVERLLLNHFGDFDSEIDMFETCPNCKGTGEVARQCAFVRNTRRTTGTTMCWLCHGTGKRRIDDKQDGPQVILVEYIGACRERSQPTHPFRTRGAGRSCLACGGSGSQGVTRFAVSCYRCHGTGVENIVAGSESFASAWINGGWNAVFPEDVLRAYFPPPPEKFDGDFYKALLQSSDLSKEYKRLARQFHPDLNKKRDAQQMFVKLREAFDTLNDPKRRKRYEAGLKFQKLTDTQKQEVVFRIPKACGRVSVEGKWSIRANAASVSGTEEKLTVSKILNWEDVYDKEGRVMCSSWNPTASLGRITSDPPFIITWEWNSELIVDV